jgi:hypothetical protein
MNRSVTSRFLFAGLILVFAGAQSFAGLSEGSWYLDRSNEHGDGLYGRVDISADSSTGEVHFHVVSYAGPAYGKSDGDAGFKSFGFNYTGIPASSWIWTGTRPSNWIVRTNRTQDGFGEFDVVVMRGYNANCHDPLDFGFTLPTPSLAVASNFAALSSGYASQGNAFFAGGLVSDERCSQYVGGSTPVTAPPPIPAPGAALLGPIGLSLVAMFKWRQS